MPRIKSLSALQAQIRSLQKRAATIEAKADKKVTQLVALIQQHGLSLGDWRRAVSLSKGGHKRGGPRKGKRVPVKYSDDKGNKWTGRGRPPLWLVAAEKAGKKRDSFLVKAAAKAAK
ncbi:MAG TPA: H-NS histone family protein [Reyranella sp.]|jgi:DNA-binding protein H-NS